MQALLLLSVVTIFLFTPILGMTNLFQESAATVSATASENQSTNQTMTENANLPTVLFPNKEEVAQYAAEAIVNFTDLSNGKASNASKVSNASNPDIAASGNNTYVVWQDNNNTSNYEIYLSLSRDGGLHFVGPVNLSNNTGNSTIPQVGTLEQEVFVLWQDNTPGNYEIFVSVSMDGGNTFKTYNLTNSTSDSINPMINTEGNKALWLWTERICENVPAPIGQLCKNVLYAHQNRSW
jgi:hypothetical protein